MLTGNVSDFLGFFCGGQNGTGTSTTPVFRFGPVSVTPPSLHTHISSFYQRSNMDRDSSVGIATRYGMDGPGDRIPVGARFSAPVQTGLRAHPAPYTMGTGSFPGVKRPQRGVDHPPNLELRLRKD